MVNGVGWDLLFNGSMVQAAYEVYNGADALNGYVFAILYILFQSMLFYKTRKLAPGIVMGFFVLTMIYSNQLFDVITLHASIAWVTGTVLVVQIAALFISIILKH